MNDDPLSALLSAWRVSLIASVALFAALAISSVWNTPLYFAAVNEALAMDHF